MSDINELDNDNHVTDNGLDQLDSLKHQMELRGTELGKTWSELSRIMAQYQCQLVQKHDNYKASLNADDQMRIAKLESLIEKKSLQLVRLEKSNSDLETRLLEKDSEIVRLRTELHQCRNEVNMKDSLIEKLQSQMAKESVEYQSELASLKEMLQQSGETDNPGASKRRRLAPAKAVVNAIVASTSSVLKDSSLQSIRLPAQSAFTSETVLATNETGVETEAFRNPDNDEAFYKMEEMDDSLQNDEYSGRDDDNSGLDGGLAHDISQISPYDFHIRAPPTSGLWVQQQLSRMDDRPHQCLECKKKFRRAEHLKIHHRIHTGDLPFKCAICQARFRVKWNCTTHVRTKHGQLNDTNNYVVFDSLVFTSLTRDGRK